LVILDDIAKKGWSLVRYNNILCFVPTRFLDPIASPGKNSDNKEQSNIEKQNIKIAVDIVEEKESSFDNSTAAYKNTFQRLRKGQLDAVDILTILSAIIQASPPVHDIRFAFPMEHLLAIRKFHDLLFRAIEKHSASVVDQLTSIHQVLESSIILFRIEAELSSFHYECKDLIFGGHNFNAEIVPAIERFRKLPISTVLVLRDLLGSSGHSKTHPIVKSIEMMSKIVEETRLHSVEACRQWALHMSEQIDTAEKTIVKKAVSDPCSCYGQIVTEKGSAELYVTSQTMLIVSDTVLIYSLHCISFNCIRNPDSAIETWILCGLIEGTSKVMQIFHQADPRDINFTKELYKISKSSQRLQLFHYFFFFVTLLC
jgi:hypothetical protein